MTGIGFELFRLISALAKRNVWTDINISLQKRTVLSVLPFKRLQSNDMTSDVYPHHFFMDLQITRRLLLGVISLGVLCLPLIV